MRKQVSKNNQNSILLKAISFCLLLFVFLNSSAYDTKNPTVHDIEREKKKMDDVGIDFEKKGESINLSLPFQNEAGETKTIGSFIQNGKPALLSVVYYSCPSLCNLHMNGVVDSFRGLDLEAGKDFNWITISMDDSEKSELARNKKESYIKNFSKPDQARKGWNFLVGSTANIKEITEQLGFKFKWDEETKQFAHTSAVYALTPEGKISQIINGTEFDPKTLKFSLIEASKGQVGTFIDRALMMCFQFNPVKNKFTIYAYNVMKIGGAVTLLLLGIFMIPLFLKENRKN